MRAPHRVSRMAQRGIVFLAVAGVLLWTAVTPASVAAQTEQAGPNRFAGNPGAIEQGRSLFRSRCSLCHGMDARGGRAPDLTTGDFVHGNTDAALFATIQRGIAGTEMAGQRADRPPDEIWMIIAYLRTLGAGANEPARGDPAAGEKIFRDQAKCSACHMVNGQGGRLGPDLSRIGAMRSRRFLEEKIRNPNKELPPESEAVTVVTRDGQRITGARRNEDTFSIQLMDAQERLHSFFKKDLRQVTSEPRSVMPAFNETQLSASQLDDLVAYLGSLRGVKQ